MNMVVEMILGFVLLLFGLSVASMLWDHFKQEGEE